MSEIRGTYLVVDVFQVLEGDGPAHQVLVQGLDQVHGRDLPVHQRLAQDAACDSNREQRQSRSAVISNAMKCTQCVCAIK